MPDNWKDNLRTYIKVLETFLEKDVLNECDEKVILEVMDNLKKYYECVFKMNKKY